AIAGDEEELIAQRLRQHGWNSHRLALRSPDESRPVLDEEGEPESEKEAIERIAPIERPDQHPFNQQTNKRGEQRRDQQRAPKPHIRRDAVGNVTADDEEPAVGEIYHVAEVENEREAKRHENVKGADDQAVGN